MAPLHLALPGPLVAGALAAVLAVPQAAAHGPAHMIAQVNDPRSHGQLGDGLLSLDEVIRVNQRLLTMAQLSATERAQIWGFGEDIGWADINFTITPTITLERDLTPIFTQPHPLVIAGSNGRPVIEIGATRGFVIDSNWVDFSNLILRGGAIAIDLTQPDALFGTTISDVAFEGQTSCAVRVVLDDAGARSRLEIDKTTFSVPGKAIEIFDSGADRSGQLVFRRLDIRGGQLGIGLHLGPGGTLLAILDRCSISGTTNGISIDRPTAADTRRMTLDALHLTMSGVENAFACEGDPAVADALTLRMLDLGARSRALRLWPQGTAVSAAIEDSRLAGGIEVLTGAAPGGIRVSNCRISSGTLVAGGTGAPLRIIDTVLEGVTTTTLGSSGLVLDDCRFDSGSIQGIPSAPVAIQSSYLGSVAIGPHVSVTTALPAPQLGFADASPLEVPRGGRVDLIVDLPPGLVGFWIVGVAETIPIPTPFGTLYYFQSAHVVIPVPVRLGARFGVPIPNNASLLGWDFVAQLAVLPDPGFPAPPLSLPPGRRFVVR